MLFLNHLMVYCRRLGMVNESVVLRRQMRYECTGYHSYFFLYLLLFFVAWRLLRQIPLPVKTETKF